jgi:hypothetical protein
VGVEPQRARLERRIGAFPRNQAVDHLYEVRQIDGVVEIAHNGRLARRSRTADDALAWFNLHLRRMATTDLAPLVGLHAAALSVDGRAVALLGASGSGKSTLAAELVRRGFRYLSDEVAAIDPRTLSVTPVPLPLVLDPGSWELFEPQLVAAGHAPPPRVGSWMVDPSVLAGPRAPQPADPRRPDDLALAICVGYRPGAPLAVTTLDPPTALVELLANVFELHRGRAVVEALAGVARVVPCRRVEHGDLGKAADAVERLLEENSSQQL